MVDWRALAKDLSDPADLWECAEVVAKHFDCTGHEILERIIPLLWKNAWQPGLWYGSPLPGILEIKLHLEKLQNISGPDDRAAYASQWLLLNPIPFAHLLEKDEIPTLGTNQPENLFLIHDETFELTYYKESAFLKNYHGLYYIRFVLMNPWKTHSWSFVKQQGPGKAEIMSTEHTKALFNLDEEDYSYDELERMKQAGIYGAGLTIKSPTKSDRVAVLKSTKLAINKIGDAHMPRFSAYLEGTIKYSNGLSYQPDSKGLDQPVFRFT